MNMRLRRLSLEDQQDMDIYAMLQECPREENGFLNGACGLSLKAYAVWIRRQEEISRGIRLPPNFVRQTQFWLLADNHPVGSAKLRHGLSPALREEGGNIGYGVRPSERGKGYGPVLLALMLEEAKRDGLDKVLVTINNDNIPSLRTAERNGGNLKRQTVIRSYYWFDLK